jgi:hypothetical protein
MANHNSPLPDNGAVGTVLCNFGGGVLVEDTQRRAVLCKTRKSIDKPVAGDRVELKPMVWWMQFYQEVMK